VIVKYESDRSGDPGEWLPAIKDPADLFVTLYDLLPGVTERQRPQLAESLWRSDPLEGQRPRLGELLDAWYQDPDVQRCAEQVQRLAQAGPLDRREISRAAPSGVAPAIFALLLGLDRALSHAHPRQRGTRLGALSPVALRYVRTGRLSTGDVPGALLPRTSGAGDPGGGVLARCFLSVERIPAEVWARIAQRRLPPHLDIGRPAGDRQLRIAFAPLLATEDLAVSVVRNSAIRLAPRDTRHLRGRIATMLAALDDSGAAIAVLPDHALSPSLLAYWRQLLRSTPAPDGSALKWLLVGAGVIDAAEPRVSRAVLLDRDLGDIVLAQDKLVPASVELRQATILGLDDEDTAALLDKDVASLPAAALAEDIAPGTQLAMADAGIGRIAILAGEQPDQLGAALRHVTHLLRAETVAAAPIAGSPAAGPSAAGPSATGPAAAGFLQPDELAVLSLADIADDVQVRAGQPWQQSAAPPGAAAVWVAELAAARSADPGAFLHDGAERIEALLSAHGPGLPPRQAAVAFQLLAQVNADRGRLSAADAAVDRAIAAAQSAGAQFVEARARALRCQFRCWGDQPLPGVAAHVSAELDWADSLGYPHLRLTGLGALAQTRALAGLADSALGLLEQAALLGEELILRPDSAELAAQHAIAAASVLAVAGQLADAAAVLDRGDWALRRIGAIRLRPPVLALSARLRYRMGATERAHELLDACDRMAPPDDVAVQAGRRSVRALLLARHGDHLLAEQVARSAVQAGDWSERVDVQAQTRADLVRVLLEQGRAGEAALPAAWALRLYERKGDVVSAAAIRELLPAEQPAPEPPLRAEAWILPAEPEPGVARSARRADQPGLVAGLPSRIAIRLHGAASPPPTSPAAASANGSGGAQEVLVTLIAADAATVTPHGRRIPLPRSGSSEPLTFEVTPRTPAPLRLHFLVNLYREGTLLQELGVTMPVATAEGG
jgi:hypothetical protein